MHKAAGYPEEGTSPNKGLHRGKGLEDFLYEIALDWKGRWALAGVLVPRAAVAEYPTGGLLVFWL